MTLRALPDPEVIVDLGSSKIAESFVSALDEAMAALWKTGNSNPIADIRGLKTLIESVI